jgi:hypothetical protein
VCLAEAVIGVRSTVMIFHICEARLPPKAHNLYIHAVHIYKVNNGLIRFGPRKPNLILMT